MEQNEDLLGTCWEPIENFMGTSFGGWGGEGRGGEGRGGEGWGGCLGF
jgi:hypothetical protein